jgi:hypothetical protein
MIASQLLQREWRDLREEYISHPEFREYVEGIQAEHRAAKVAAAFTTTAKSTGPHLRSPKCNNTSKSPAFRTPNDLDA